jgi:hypothetical protein
MELAHVYGALAAVGVIALIYLRIVAPILVSLGLPAPLYDTLTEEPADVHEAPFSPFERAERPPFVQPEQVMNDVPSPGELDRIDAAAAALAAGWAGEAAIIETMFSGVKRGGSARYTALRDAVRARAQVYGWQASPPPAPPRVVTVTENGRKREVEL